MNKFQCFVLLIVVPSSHSEVAIYRTAEEKTAGPFQFPFFAQVEVRNITDKEKDKYYTVGVCGASLFHPDWVVSPAHCFSNFMDELPYMRDQSLLIVYMGTLVRFGNDADINFIDDVAIHENFIRNPESIYNVSYTGYLNDVAVAKLRNSFVLGQHSNVVYLPQPANAADKAIRRCRRGIIVGVGSSGKVSYAKAKPKTNTEVRAVVDDHSTLFFTEVKWLDRPPFTGDSGGAFICQSGEKYVLYGILSIASNRTSQGTVVSEYQEVDKHMEFILRTVPVAQFQIVGLSKSSPLEKNLASTLLCISFLLFMIMLNQ